MFCAGPRHDERRLSLSRPDPAGPPRRGIAVSDGLAAAAGRIQARVGRCYMLPELKVFNSSMRAQAKQSKAAKKLGCLVALLPAATRNCEGNTDVLRGWVYRRGAEEEPRGLSQPGKKGGQDLA